MGAQRRLGFSELELVILWRALDGLDARMADGEDDDAYAAVIRLRDRIAAALPPDRPLVPKTTVKATQAARRCELG